MWLSHVMEMQCMIMVNLYQCTNLALKILILYFIYNKYKKRQSSPKYFLKKSAF